MLSNGTEVKMDKGNADNHIYTYSKVVKALEEGRWGRDCARARYGALDYENRPPPYLADFETYGVGVIEKLREMSPEKYVELAGRLIMTTEPPQDGRVRLQTT